MDVSMNQIAHFACAYHSFHGFFAYIHNPSGLVLDGFPGARPNRSRLHSTLPYGKKKKKALIQGIADLAPVTLVVHIIRAQRVPMGDQYALPI